MRNSCLFIGILINFHLLTASESSGCKALSLATKNDVTIASIGVSESQMVCWDTELLFNTLESWKAGDTAITCVFFFPIPQEEKKYIEKYIENYRARFTKLPFSYALLSYAHGHMRPENSKKDFFTAGSLTFAFTQHTFDFPLPGIVNALHNNCFSVLDLNSYTQGLCKLTLAEFERLPMITRQTFFNSPLYKRLKQAIAKVHPVKTTITEFFKLLEERFSFIQELRQKYELGDAVRLVIDDLERDLRNYIKETRQFISSLEKNQENPLLSVLLNLIKSKSSFLDALKEWRIVFHMRLPDFEAFHCLSFIDELGKMHKNIFFMNYLAVSERIYAQLSKIGFEVQITGRTAQVGEIKIMKGKPIEGQSPEKVPLELVKEVSFEKEGSNEEHIQDLGVTFSGEQLEQYLSTVFTSRPLLPRIGVLSTLTFDPRKSLSFDRRMARCIGKSCDREIPRYLAVAFSENEEPFCSNDCVLSHCLNSKNANLFTLLKGSQELSVQEQEMLRKYAILCYLRSLTISPSIIQEDSFFYQLNHERISHALATIGKSADGTGWAEVLKDAETFGIKLTDISILFQMYAIVKKNYLNALFAKAIASYEAMDNFLDDTVLDQERKLPACQKVHIQRIKKLFHFNEKTADLVIGTLYFELFQKIIDRLGVESLDCIALLNNEKPQQVSGNTASISDIMRELGYVEKENDSDSDVEMQNDEASPISSPDDSETPNQITTANRAVGVSQAPAIQDPQDINVENLPVSRFPQLMPQQRHSPIMHKMQALFAKRLPYTITLFKVKENFEKTLELKEAHRCFKTCNHINLASRLKLLFALSEKLLAIDPVIIDRDAYGALIIKKNNSVVMDQSLKDKLNINHLFPRSVDDFLQSYGIVEKDNDLIRVSIPGALCEESGHLTVGFFQYTFIPKKWICIHRCFVHYAAHKDDEKYVTKALRTALYRFLTETMADHPQYNDVIADLKSIIEC